MQGPVPPRVKNFSSLFPKIDQLSLISVQIAIFSLIHVSLASPILTMMHLCIKLYTWPTWTLPQLCCQYYCAQILGGCTSVRSPPATALLSIYCFQVSYA